MKDKLTKIVLYISGVFALFIFIIVRFEESPKFLLNPALYETESKGIYGDLYDLNLLEYFKIPVYDGGIMFSKKGNVNTLDSSGVVLFGDSFFGGTSSKSLFHERLQGLINLKTFFSNADAPLMELAKLKLNSSKKRLFVFEIVERRIADYFKTSQKSEDKVGFIKSIKGSLFNKVETKYDYLLHKSLLTSYFYEIINSFKFNYLNYISDLTPVYSVNPPWLFYHQEVSNKNTGFYYNFSEKEIEEICINILDLKNKIKEIYNMEFVIIPVPNKYTIYHKIINNDSYNNFLPKLYDGLKKNGVPCIELYRDFITSEKTLYFSTDTHWNEDGEKIALQKLSQFILSQKYLY